MRCIWYKLNDHEISRIVSWVIIVEHASMKAIFLLFPLMYSYFDLLSLAWTVAYSIRSYIIVLKQLRIELGSNHLVSVTIEVMGPIERVEIEKTNPVLICTVPVVTDSSNHSGFCVETL